MKTWKYLSCILLFFLLGSGCIADGNIKSKLVDNKADCSLKTVYKKTIVTIKNYPPLNFIHVKKHDGIIKIGLTEAQAQEFLRKSQALLPPNSPPLYPFLFKAVSDQEMPKVVAGFWIQETTIKPKIYQDIISGGSVNSVSYQDAIKVIKQLNEWCQGKARFELPQEKHFVHLARAVYNPIMDGKLQACEKVKDLHPHGVKQVLGHKWQLTSSFCQPLGLGNNHPIRACDEQSYVKKGGSIGSKDATECMPEYRAESTPDIREPNTTFRLILFKKYPG